MKIKPFVTVLFVAFVTACQNSETVQNSDRSDACGAIALQNLIGQSETDIQTIKFAGPVRILSRNDVMTMDFNPHRINIMLDDVGIVEIVRCG